MLENKTIFIAHNWSDVSANLQSKSLALYFSKKNKVIFLSAKKKGETVKIINENLTVFEWPGKRPVGWKDFLFAYKLMKQTKPQIIITNFAANDVMLLAAWLLGVKKRVCYFHTMVQQYLEDNQKLDIKQRMNILRKGFVFRKATHMLAPSKFAKNDLIKYYKVEPGKIYVFPNALPETPIRNEPGRNQIGFLGRLDRSKGVDILIEAFKILHNEFKDVKLLIAGTGKKENELRGRITELKLTNNVLFKGAIPYTQVPDFLKSLNFLVVPSRVDNLPTAALEALSTGTPLVGSNAGGIPEIIQNGFNGLLFENENINSLYLQMKKMYADNTFRNEISMNARKSFVDKFCVDNYPLRLEKILSDKI